MLSLETVWGVNATTWRRLSRGQVGEKKGPVDEDALSTMAAAALARQLRGANGWMGGVGLNQGSVGGGGGSCGAFKRHSLHDSSKPTTQPLIQKGPVQTLMCTPLETSRHTHLVAPGSSCQPPLAEAPPTARKSLPRYRHASEPVRRTPDPVELTTPSRHNW
jgi:hypothetical protein